MFIPIFQPPDGESPNRRQAVKMIFVGLFLAVGVGLLLVFTRGLMSAPALFMVIAGMVVLAVAALFVLANGAAEKDKRKRGLDGLDMYTLIDRLVDDLDDDEAAYLQRRLDERQTAEKDDLAQSVESLLERRSQDRQS